MARHGNGGCASCYRSDYQGVHQDHFCLASLFVLLIGFISNLLRTTEWLGVCRLSASSG